MPTWCWCSSPILFWHWPPFNLFPSSCITLFQHLKRVFFLNIEKCPFTYWLNGIWLLQIVDREFEHGVKWKVISPDSRYRDSGNLYPIYPPFPWGGGGGCPLISACELGQNQIQFLGDEMIKIVCRPIKSYGHLMSSELSQINVKYDFL